MRSWMAAAAVLACVAAVFGQGPQAPAMSAIGPGVGERVPDFALEDQDGTRRTLRSIMGPKGAMIVFFRSADW